MSEKKIAASTPYRRTGCRVISVTRSGRMHDSSIRDALAHPRYSGSERPAWRMNHTGVCGTGSRRAARTRAERRSRRGGIPGGGRAGDGGVRGSGVVTRRSSHSPGGHAETDRAVATARRPRRDGKGHADLLHPLEPLVEANRARDRDAG